MTHHRYSGHSPKRPARSALALAALAALLLAASARLTAEDLTLEDALSLAEAGNAALALQKTALEQAKRAASYSWNALLPNVSLSGSITNTHPIDPAGDGETTWSAGAASASSDPLAFSAEASSAWSASVGINLKPIAAVPVQMKSASAALRREEETYREALAALRTSVSTGFYRLLADKENTGILRDALALARNQYEETQKKHARGLSSELDLLNAELAYRKAGPALDDAERAYQASLGEFRLMLGLAADDAREPAGAVTARQLALPGAEALAAQYGGERPDVKKAEIAVETERLTGLAAKLQARAPAIGLSEAFTLTPGPAASGDSASKAASSQGAFTLSVSIPLTTWLPFSSSALSIRAQDEAAADAALTLESTRKEAALDIRKKADALERAAEKITSEALPRRIAERAYELSRQGYEAGLLSQTDLLEARQEMVEARQAELEAEIAHIGAAYALAEGLGLESGEMYARYGREAGEARSEP